MKIQLIGTLSLVRKETGRVLRIWVQTLIPPGITMSLYFIIFGTLIGKRIGEMQGFPYMEYIAPGPWRNIFHVGESLHFAYSFTYEGSKDYEI